MTWADTEVLDALLDYAEARRELAECVEGCDHDAGYYCASQYDRVARTAKQANDLLDERIRRVASKEVV